MNLTVIQQPPFEPVTLQQVYTHLRLDPYGSPLEHSDDAMLLGHITTARIFVEQMARRSLVQQTIRLSCPFFPLACYGWGWLPSRYRAVERINLLRPPIVRVERVQFYDGDNALQTVAPADYYVTDDVLPELRFVSAYGVPAVYDRPDALRVEYVAGYAPEGSPALTQAEYAANVPQPLKDAILIGVQLLYDNLAPADRQALINAREAMVQPYRIQLTP